MEMTDDSPDVVLLLTTLPVELEVETWVRPLLETGLAACVSVLPPMRSTYRWQGAVETAEERQLIVKTTKARLAAVEADIKSRHPYEVPELLVLPVSGGGDAYLRWLRAETA